jgi:hypothetical protein
LSENIIQEFLVELGFKVDQEGERKLNSTLATTLVKTHLIADGIEEASRAIARYVQETAKHFESLQWSSERTGASVQHLQSLAYSFSQIGLSAQGAGATVEAFAKSLRTQPGNLDRLKSYGITAGDTVDQMLKLVETLNKQFPDSANHYQYAIGERIAAQFGIDEQTYYQLTHNAGALAKFRKQYEEFAKGIGADPQAGEKFRKLMQDFRTSTALFQTVLQNVAADLAPQIEKALDGLDKWLTDPKHVKEIENAADAIGKFTKEAAEGFGQLATNLEPVWTGIGKITEAIGGKNKGLVAALETLVALWAANKFLRILFGLGGGGAKLGLTGWILGALGLYDAFGGPSLTKNPLHEPKPGDHVTTPEEYASHFMTFGDVWNWTKKKVKHFLGFDDTDAKPSPAIKGHGREALAREAYDFWRANGLSRQAALGVVANEDVESAGFKIHAPGDYNPRTGKYEARGAFQWHEDRRDAILKATGIDVWSNKTTHRQMLEAALWELKHSKDTQARKAWDMLQHAATEKEAAAAFSSYFERPADKYGQAVHRGIRATQWAEKIPEGTYVADSRAEREKQRVIPAAPSIIPPLVDDRLIDALRIHGEDQTPKEPDDQRTAPVAPDLKRASVTPAATAAKTNPPIVSNAGDKNKSAQRTAPVAPRELPIVPKVIPDIVNDRLRDFAKMVNNSSVPAAIPPAPPVTNYHSRNITISPNTTITVHGASDPNRTADAISRAQNTVHANILRDTKGAAR